MNPLESVKVLQSLTGDSFEVALIPVIAEIVASEGVPERILRLRLYALQKLQGTLNYYRKCGYLEKLLYGIAEKKGAMILQITSKTEMDKMLKPQCPHYNGNRFIPGDYDVPEEELIGWSEASLRAPLSSIGQKRYMELFREILPEKSKELQF